MCVEILEEDVLHVTTAAKPHGVKERALRLLNSLEKPESANSVINSLNAIKERYRRMEGAWGEIMALGWHSLGSGTPLWQKTTPSFHFSFTSSKTKCDFQV